MNAVEAFLDCCCCKCCDYEFCTCCNKCSGFCSCCLKCVCSAIDIKEEEINKGKEEEEEEEEEKKKKKETKIKDYKDKMNTFRNREKEIIEKLEDLRTDYIIKKESDLNNEAIPCCDCNYTCQCLFYYLAFSIISLSHFFLMAIIEAVIFSLMREIFRTFHFYYYGEYDKYDKKDFKYYLTISSKNDTSQINFNYLSSIITNFFVFKTNLYIPYLISNLGIIITIASMLLFDFKNWDEIQKGDNYQLFDFFVLLGILVVLYTFSGIISLYPVYIIKQSKFYRRWSILLICFLLTFSVCVKNWVQGKNEFNLLSHLYLIIPHAIILTFIVALYHCYYPDDLKINENENGLFIKDEVYSVEYSLGNLIIENNVMKVSIKLKAFCSYLVSVFCKGKILFILGINFFGRAQKMKSKIDYKTAFNEEFCLTIINFGLSFIFYSFLYFLIYCNIKGKQGIEAKEITEQIIIIGLIIENFAVIILSSLEFSSNKNAISFFIIAISGCFNFILFEYYSTVEIEYITASGFISIPQIIFRILEKFLDCEDKRWLWWQIFCGIIGLILNICYIMCIFSKKEDKSEMIILNSSLRKIFKNYYPFKCNKCLK